MRVKSSIIMISFVWFRQGPFLPGTGGSENYTVGHIRELQSRGIASRIITVGLGKNDGREAFPGIEFKDVKTVHELSALNDTLIFIVYPHAVPTKRQAFVILHCPLSLCDTADVNQYFVGKEVGTKKLITPSKFAAKMWGAHFDLNHHNIPVVYPFADKHFAQQPQIKRQSDGKVRLLYAGRLTPDKGIYTLLAAMHMSMLRTLDIVYTATDARSDNEEGKIIKRLLQAHPHINLVASRKTPKDMALLMAENDILVMPTTNKFWNEAFGMLSIEAQHAGCRVVASNAGGLPETDCGGLILVEPDNPLSLAEGIVKAAKLGRLTAAERAQAIQKFTLKESVDRLLNAIGWQQTGPRPFVSSVVRGNK